MNSATSENKTIDQLISSGMLSVEAIERIRSTAQHSGASFFSVVTRLGLITEQEMANVFSNLLDLDIVRAEHFPSHIEQVDGLNLQYFKSKHIVLLSLSKYCIQVAMANPTDTQVLSGLTYLFQRDVAVKIAYESDIAAFYHKLATQEQTKDGLLSELNSTLTLQASEDDLDRLADHTSEAPVIRLVNRLLLNASDRNASDIHVEPNENGLIIRYRIDGMLHEVENLPSRWVEPVASRIKLLAKLDIAEKRLPQDGRIQFSVRGKNIDLRIATFPTLHGESIVLRLLGKESVKLDLARIGLSKQGLVSLQAALNKPHGIVLITGPTGSGKTTTLYAALNYIRNPQLKIVTVEDPVEYTLQGVSQLQIKPEIGLTYPAALRSVLRNDPDVIMIGEIRDQETAEIAIRASLTGHLVLSTLHTNTAVGAVTRLLDIGIDDYLLASTLELVAAQRLVRKLCDKCKKKASLTDSEQRIINSVLGAVPEYIYQATGCNHCDQHGYIGRIPLFEAITIGDQERAMIRDWRDEQKMMNAFTQSGGVDLWAHGIQKVVDGETSMAEIMRVVECRA